LNGRTFERGEWYKMMRKGLHSKKGKDFGVGVKSCKWCGNTFFSFSEGPTVPKPPTPLSIFGF
jgi:hypothetical protein